MKFKIIPENNIPISFKFLFLLFCITYSANSLSAQNLVKKNNKKSNKSDFQLVKVKEKFYSILKKESPDSALHFLSLSDTLIKKLSTTVRNKIALDLGDAFEGNNNFDAALNQYYAVLKDAKSKSKEETQALGSIIKIYSKAQVTDSLHKYLKVATVRFKTEREMPNVLKRLFIKAHFLKGYFDSVVNDLKVYKKYHQNEELPSHIRLNIALMLIKQGKYSEANAELINIVHNADLSHDLDTKVKSELLEIEILTSWGKEKEAFARSKTVYEKYKNDKFLSPEAKGIVYYNYANQLFRNGKYKEALEANEEAIKWLKGFTLENNHAHAKALLLSALIYNDLTDFGAAHLYLTKAQSIYEQSCGENNTYFDEFIYAHAHYLYSIEKYKEAKIEINKAQALQKRIYGNNNVSLAQSFNLEGNIYEKLGETESSKRYLDSSLTIYKLIVEDRDHPLYGKLYNDIGIVEQKKEVIPASIKSYTESLRIFEKLYGKVHPEVAVGYANVASLYMDIEEYPKAFQFIQRSLMANCINYLDTSVFSNPVNNLALSDFLLLKTSVLKSKSLKLWGDSLDKSGRGEVAIKYYKAAIDNYFFCLKVINRLRNSYVSEESKVYLTEKVAFIYEDGINVSRLIYKKTKDDSYLDKAFAFSEKSKAGLLLSAILESNAKKISGLPDSLLERERKINAKISQLDKDLFKELKKGKKADPEKVDNLKKGLFEQKGNLIAYLKFIESNYEKYFNLKYDDRVTSIKDVQNTLLDKDNKRLLVEYFVGKDSIFIFCLSHDQFNIVTVKKESNFSRNILGLTNSIRYNIGSVFVRCSIELYDQLLRPIEDKIHKKIVVVVPDVAFVGLPLQTFMNSTDPAKMETLVNKGKYSQLPFAVFKTAMSYEISAAVALQNASTKKKDTILSKYPHRLFVLAPVFEPNSRRRYVLESEPSVLPKLELDTAQYNYPSPKIHLAQLPGTEQEAISLIKLFKSKKSPARAYLYNFAQKKLIQSQTLGYYNYIHFATHGEMNLSRSEYSGLYINDADSVNQEGIFHLGNVYTLDLKAQLVTLSACESGLGKVINGEGIMGFARAFTYSGTESILVSLWNLNDPAAAVMMKNFYKNIFKTTYKSEALQKAQIKLARSRKTQSPYYWAPFVLYGK
jgi:CHAT domain-containing protein